MWDGMYPAETDQALRARVQYPEAPPPLQSSAWAKIGSMISAPYTGAAQGLNESLRVMNQLVSARPRADSAESQADRHSMSLWPAAEERMRSMRADSRRKNDEMSKSVDEYLRGAVDYWNPDPVTSTTASMVLHQGARMLTKAAGYAALGGTPGMVVGTGIDEGMTGYLEMRDKGVDRSTAAKVGLVRGATAGASVAIPVVGATGLQTAGLIALGGPASFMAEQALTRDVLESAQYPELANQYNPLDPLGLTLSIAIPGVIGAAAHAIRLRNPTAAALADSSEHLEAAHVVYRDDQLKTGAMADPSDSVAMAAHTEHVRRAAQALEDGQRVEVPDAVLSPAHAEAALRDTQARMETLRPELEAAARETGATSTRPDLAVDSMDQPNLAGHLAEPATEVAPRGTPRDAIEAMGRDLGAPPEVMQMASAAVEALQRVTDMAQRAAEPQQARSALKPAEDVVARRPDLPVRLDDAGPAATVRDVVDHVRAEAARDRQDSRAFVAAIECALRSGS